MDGHRHQEGVSIKKAWKDEFRNVRKLLHGHPCGKNIFLGIKGVLIFFSKTVIFASTVIKTSLRKFQLFFILKQNSRVSEEVWRCGGGGEGGNLGPTS
jgi:hypothetical protein